MKILNRNLLLCCIYIVERLDDENIRAQRIKYTYEKSLKLNSYTYRPVSFIYYAH